MSRLAEDHVQTFRSSLMMQLRCTKDCFNL